jgi:Rac GTPase-activating protein 1
MNPPMVPAIVVHCIKEVEKKGPSEIGVYRVPGSEKDVKALKVRHY